MSDTLIYGICDSCEKKYRVPSADKTYPCKACGGTVAVHEIEETRTASERFNARRGKDRGKAPIWIGTLLMLVAVGTGLVGYQVGWFGTVLGADVDPRLFGTNIEAVDAALAEAWSAGDAEGLAAMHHPTGREEFFVRLGAFPEHRAWSAAWPSLTKHKGELEGGSASAPEKAVSSATFGDSSLRVKWQYDSNVGRWFIYNFWITPTELAPRVESFRLAWANSDTTALRPFFSVTKADQLQELFDKQLAKAGWNTQHPQLGKVELSGEEATRHPVGEFLGVKVESVFASGDKSILIRWRFDQKADEWMVSGLQF